MAERRSRFGLNLFALIVFQIILLNFVRHTPRAASQVLEAISEIFNLTIGFGVIYAIFRIFGVKGGAIEAFFQYFPIGFLFMEDFPDAKDYDEAGAGQTRKSGKPPLFFDLNVQTLFSINYTRYAGLLLLISALFAFLFRIEWSTGQKLIAALVGAGTSLALAEFCRTRAKQTLAAILFFNRFFLPTVCCDNFVFLEH